MQDQVRPTLRLRTISPSFAAQNLYELFDTRQPEGAIEQLTSNYCGRSLEIGELRDAVWHFIAQANIPDTFSRTVFYASTTSAISLQQFIMELLVTPEFRSNLPALLATLERLDEAAKPTNAPYLDALGN
jgi:hypothetical protein